MTTQPSRFSESGSIMRTFTDEDCAERYCRHRNGPGRVDLAVIVDGPDDGEWTVMAARDAIDDGFTYWWVA